MKPYRSTHHVPGHVLHRADSNATYPQHNGNWFCDRCRQRYNSKHAPYHCSQCEYDLCESCMKGAGEESNAGKMFNYMPYLFLGFQSPSLFPNCLTKYNVGKLRIL